MIATGRIEVLQNTLLQAIHGPPRTAPAAAGRQQK
jgi:hypothetical protein